MKQFAPGLRGGSYYEADNLNMQIEIFKTQFCALLEAAVLAEREACARIAEDEWSYDSTECGADVAADIAALIRKRGQE